MNKPRHVDSAIASLRGAGSITCLFTDHMTNNDQRPSYVYCVDFILPRQRCTIISHGHQCINHESQEWITHFWVARLIFTRPFLRPFYQTLNGHLSPRGTCAYLQPQYSFRLMPCLNRCFHRNFTVKPQCDSCHTKGAGAEASSS